MQSYKEKMQEMGRKGGKKSKRKLTTKQAQEMVNKRWRKNGSKKEKGQSN